jgi:hypothetical protein
VLGPKTRIFRGIGGELRCCVESARRGVLCLECQSDAGDVNCYPAVLSVVVCVHFALKSSVVWSLWGYLWFLRDEYAKSWYSIVNSVDVYWSRLHERLNANAQSEELVSACSLVDSIVGMLRCLEGVDSSHQLSTGQTLTRSQVCSAVIDGSV